MAGIIDMYDQISQTADLPEIGEMLFYSGSPTADVLVISEAPTWTDGDDETFFSTTVDRYQSADWGPDELEQFWREYPFTDELGKFGFPDETRHRLYRQYVDDLLSFLDTPRESVGFTDVAKRPLENEQDLEDVLTGRYDYQETIRSQLDYVNPEVIVCNKANVSKILPQLLDLPPLSERSDLPTRLKVSMGDMQFHMVFSAMAHMYMDNFSKKRLVREIKWAYDQRMNDE